MKTYIIAGAAVIAVAAGIAVAAPGDVRSLVGADGSVSVADLRKQSAERFATIDTNKDGQLSQQEMQAARPERGDRGPRGRGMHGRGPAGEFGMRGGPGGPAPGGPGGPGGPGPMFQGADKDGNGAVTQAEFTAQAVERFQRLDANRDGQIAGDEARPMRGRMGARAGRMGQMGQMGQRRFAMLDTDRNGSVSRAEFNRPFAERMTRLDANKDGKITREERRAGRRGPRAGGML